MRSTSVNAIRGRNPDRMRVSDRAHISDGEVAEWSNAAVLKTCKRGLWRTRVFPSKSRKTLLSKAYKPIAHFAPSGKEWHDKAVTLSIFANWNPPKDSAIR
jgi:hypothetical protein